MAFNPQSLVDLSRQVVNHSLHRWKDIVHLDIPLTLKKELGIHYLDDKKDQVYDNVEDMLELFNQYTFDRSNLYIAPDLYRAIMSMDCRYIPDFAYECNYVQYTWYEKENVDLFDDNVDKYCVSCMRELDEYMIKHIKLDKVRAWDLMDDVFHMRGSWCSKCTTTTLFKISEAPFRGVKRTIFELLNYSSDSE